MIFLKVLKSCEDIPLPTKATPCSAGLDLYSPYSFSVYPDARQFIELGISIEIPQRFMGLLTHRSGHNKNHGLFAHGIIDADYRGELGLTLFNNGIQVVDFKKGDKIAQLILIPIPTVVVHEVQKLSRTVRGTGGHGSTDIQEVEQYGTA